MRNMRNMRNVGNVGNVKNVETPGRASGIFTFPTFLTLTHWHLIIN